jgi:hypothetical protein
MTSEVKAVVSELSDEHIDLQRKNAEGLRLYIRDCTCIKFDTSGAGGVMGEVVLQKNHREVLIFGPTTANPSF